jgi:cyclohexanone monooxygenase
MDLTSGFIARAEHLLPKGADREPWKIHQNYALDKKLFHNGKLEDGVMIFSKPSTVGRLDTTVLTN